MHDRGPKEDRSPGSVDVSKRPQGPGSSVARAIIRNATADPDAIAIRSSERDVAYGELAALAGGLSAGLIGAGGSGPILAIVRDAIDVGVGVLAASSAGRPVVIVPEEAGESAVMSLAASAGATDAILPPGTLRLGELRTWTCDAATGSIDPVTRSPDDALALVSTSGTTGAPRFVGLLEDRFGLGSTEGSVLSGLARGMTVATTYSTASAPFGVVVRTLLAGATCSVIDARRSAPSKLLALLEAHEVSRVRMVPSVLRPLIRARASQPPLERVAVIGSVGERMHWTDVAGIRGLIPRSGSVTNAYGLTETGLLTERIIPGDEPLGEGFVSVGTPLAGRSIWIDDGSGRSAPPGTIGEIVVEGRLGATGVPLERLDGGRDRYRTGDLGSLLPDGSLQHHGRSDRESKVGGHRVDLVAIEAVFRSAPGVIDVAIIDASGDVDGTDPRSNVRRAILVAHVWAQPGTTAEALRSHASDRLLTYSMPSAIRLRDTPLPKLPSGKLDISVLR